MYVPPKALKKKHKIKLFLHLFTNREKEKGEKDMRKKKIMMEELSNFTVMLFGKKNHRSDSPCNIFPRS